MFKQRIREENLLEAKRLKNTFQIKKEHYLEEILPIFKRTLILGRIDSAITTKNDYNLTGDDIASSLIEGFSHLMKDDKKEDAYRLINELGLKREMVGNSVKDIYYHYISKAEYDDAAEIASEFMIDQDKLYEAVFLAFTMKMKSQRYRPA